MKARHKHNTSSMLTSVAHDSAVLEILP